MKDYLKYVKEILKLALPAVGEMILYMLVWVFDTMMVGHYGGKYSVAAVGFSSEIMYTVMNTLIGMGLSVSMTSIIARGLGAKDEKKTLKFANQGFNIGFVIALTVSSTYFIFAKNILNFLGAEKEIIGMASSYIRICSVGMFFTMLGNLFSGMFRGCKDTRTPLYGAMIVNCVNLVLDYLLIFGKFGLPELGVKGAALATSTAGISCFIFLFFRLKKLPIKLKFFSKIDKNIIKEILRFSIPASLQEGSFSIGKLMGVVIVMSLGSLAFSANQISVTIESISFMPGWGFSLACTALTGYCVGDGDFVKAKKYINTTAILSGIIMGTFGIIFFFFSKDIIKLFIKKDEIEVIKLGAICLQIGCFQQIGTSLGMTFSGAFKGMGDSKTPFKVSFVCNWLIRLPLMYYFLYLNKKPITYFWWITVLQWNLEAITLFICYKFKIKNLIKMRERCKTNMCEGE
ncbi:MAG: MATE family efflux transporter [Fusobacterium perfoetens]|uniref:MATE family efflux transporter n=1 Tax=Fusobacterium perfoetens TaxID=852 RepID=UPI0023F3389E|nr:MATE family efflux transporter [Fusobacterium perfoetens]MCI6151896.1 MATE family efflux transporter [Fusobacterium perfoetens]MDY3238236.1 MATE family efflux transporter [Fusobacterium perfoetens]